MIKKLAAFLFALGLFFSFLKPVSANSDNSFVTVVNPVRGEEFWDQKNQKVEDAVLGEAAILDKYNIPATWLLRYDAFSNSSVISPLKLRSRDEKGLFLEITPSLTEDAGVKYHKSQTWHSAGSIFLTGYNPNDRLKIIDTAFSKYKTVFGGYPKSVGAWWIDSYSLAYMQSKYGILSAMIVADQYSTDNYQIWGQYWGSPYYPSKTNDLIPAQDVNNKIPVVITQWAARDPVNGYGNGVEESTYSVQANDYMDYHNLDTSYFDKLVDIYTKQELNQVNQLTVGLENSYSWSKYAKEYENQIKSLSDKSRGGQFSLVTQSGFANWYIDNFNGTSPTQVVVANDPLGSEKKTVWFMDNYYRVGWFYNQDGSVIRDIHQYINGSEELCLSKACDSLNFATSATRVLDDVSFNQRWGIDDGKISNFKFSREDGNYTLTYLNEADKSRTISFMPRDISIDGKVSTVDTAILDATRHSLMSTTSLFPNGVAGSPEVSIADVFLESLKFVLFVLVVLFIPGNVMLRKSLKTREELGLEVFLSITIGMVVITGFSYLAGLLKLEWVSYILIAVFAILFLRRWNEFRNLNFPKFNKILTGVILIGTLFQVIPVFRSGLVFDYGAGFWGPNGHDGVWHIALANQLAQSMPVQNPIFSGAVLKNYHFFFDLLLATTFRMSHNKIVDLLFRFYPILFSILGGLGSYYLVDKLFKSKRGALFSLYFFYFAGSFGWVVDFIKNHGLGGESVFWANQALSFNLNPPFAISVVILLAILNLLVSFKEKPTRYLLLVLGLLSGTLIEYKSYAGILVLGSLTVFGLYELLINKKLMYMLLAVVSAAISLIIFLPNVTNQTLIIFSPFWIVHSMIDSGDRVGWVRLSTARVAYLNRGQWFKFFLTELIGLVLFVFGNLGTRFVGFIELLRVRTGLNIFLYTFLLISIAIPLLFIQAGTNWNIVQFFYYFMFIFSLLAGVAIGKVWSYKSKLLFVLMVVILIITPINTIVGEKTYFGNLPNTFISMGELSVLDKLSSLPQGVVLTYPFDRLNSQRINTPKPMFANDSTAYVSAYSKKTSFVEDEGQNDILQTPYLKRLVASKDFFSLSSIQEKRNFLKDNDISYIYLPKFYNVSLNEQDLGIKKLFESKDATLYRVDY